MLPCLGVNRQTTVFFLNCAWRCRCCCRNTISGVGQEPFIQFFGSFHNLFFTELTRVCRLSPFTKKRNRQPSCVEVVFRRCRAKAGWFCGDAVRVRGRRRWTGKRDLETPGLSSAASKPIPCLLSQLQTRTDSKRLAARRRWHEGCLRTGAMTARTSAKVRISSQRDREAAGGSAQDDVIFNEPGRRSRCRAGRRREPICRGFTRQRDTAMGRL